MSYSTIQFACVAAIGIATIGCASKGAKVDASADRRPLARPPAPATTALAFTPRVADADVNLDREGRQTVAYAGYEQQVLSVTYTRQDDRQRWGRFGDDQSQFERRSVSTTVTVRGQ